MLEKFNEPKSILLSGGADSTLLLYNLLKEQPETETRILTWTEKVTHYRSVKSAVNVINWCINATGNNNIVHIIKYGDIQSFDYLDKLAKYHGDGYKICAGITANPKESVDFGEHGWPDNDPRSKPGNNKDVWLHKGSVYVPYVNYDKKDIARMYRDNNLMDLFRLTNSCSSYDDVSHCKECWGCKERYWAFGEY